MTDDTERQDPDSTNDRERAEPPDQSSDAEPDFDRQPTGRPFSIPNPQPRTSNPPEGEDPPNLSTDEPNVDTDDVDLERIASAFEGKSEAPCLVVISGARAGELVDLPEGTTILGRQRSEVDFHFRDPGVSRRHAEVDRSRDGAVVLRDLESSNGTYLNGERMRTSTELSEGDKITLGETTTVKFTVQDEIDEQFQRRMYQSSMRDELTHTYSRAYLLEQMQTEMAFSRRNDSDVSLILFDLDHFKEVNDTYGHVAGDHLLQRLAALVQAGVRKEDLLARYGGEEFAVLVRQIALERVGEIAERLREKVAEASFDLQGEEVDMTISAGVAEYRPSQMPRPTEWLRAADDAMYRAKAAGRNCVRVGPSDEADEAGASETIQ